jgi:hypothetical protein
MIKQKEQEKSISLAVRKIDKLSGLKTHHDSICIIKSKSYSGNSNNSNGICLVKRSTKADLGFFGHCNMDACDLTEVTEQS